MDKVNLRNYNNSWYKPGRAKVWQACWFLLGAPLLKSQCISSSSFRVSLLRIFGARIGSGVVIKPGIQIKYPWHLVIGDDCWLGERCWIDNLTTVTIGKSVCVSQGAYLCTGNHDWTDIAFGLVIAPVVIHDTAWIGAMSVILPGTTIGTGSISTAGSVVSRSIPDYEIHSGNPATFLKRRVIGAEIGSFSTVCTARQSA